MERYKFFSTEPYWVISTASPMSPGGYEVISDSRYKEKYKQAKERFKERESRVTQQMLDNCKDAVGPFKDKQDATDKKIELQIKKYGNKASLTKAQKARAEELGLL